MLRQIAAVLGLILLGLTTNCCNSDIYTYNDPNKVPALTEAEVRDVWIDTAFSYTEEKRIIEAYRTIECSTNYSLSVFQFHMNAGLSDMVLMKKNSIVVMKTTSNDPRIKKSDHRFDSQGRGDLYTIGLTVANEEEPTVVLLVHDRIYREDDGSTFYRIALHEGIHSGMRVEAHSESVDAVMYPDLRASLAADLSVKDLELICDRNGCNTGLFKVCKGEN